MSIARDLCALVATIGLAWLVLWGWYAVTYMLISDPEGE
jgi:hypothetical protein